MTIELICIVRSSYLRTLRNSSRNHPYLSSLDCRRRQSSACVIQRFPGKCRRKNIHFRKFINCNWQLIHRQLPIQTASVMQSCKKINPVLTSSRLRLCLQEHSFGQSQNRKKVGIWVFPSSTPGPFDLRREIPWSLSSIFNLFSSDRRARGGGAPPPFYDVKAVLLKQPTRLCVWIKARSQTHQY